MAMLALALLIPALINGYPLIFPDSGAYLRIGYRSYFGVERASGYGLFLKPLLATGLGPWTALVGQALVVAAIIWLATRTMLGPARSALAIGLALLVSALPWHAAQLMPDAFTAPLVLLAWLAASRDRGPAATVAIGVGAVLFLTMHYTHLVLFALASIAALIAGRTTSGRWRDVAMRGLFPFALLALAALTQLGANAAILGRASVTPGGPVFLFARLHEDGLIQPWLARHCGEPRIARLCAIAPSLPRDSQQLLWDDDSPVGRAVWVNGPADLDRWPLVDEMAIANRGAILAAPGAFLASSLRGTADQLVHFGALDDECPRNCGAASANIGSTLARLDPRGFDDFAASAQATTGLPVLAVRALTSPVTALALLALLPLLVAALRRRDEAMAALLAATLAAVLANAALAGALSDVHDRYQSRIAWLAVLVAAVALLRRRDQVTADRVE